MANALIAIGLILAALYAARDSLRPGLALSWIVALVPLGLYTVMSTNPSSWAVIGLGTYWAFLLAYWRAPDRRARWVAGTGTVVAAIIATGSRTDAAAFVVVVTLAMTVFEWGPRIREIRAHANLFVLPVLTLFSAVIVFRRSSQAGVALGGLPTASVSDGSGASLLFRNLQDLPILWNGALGGWGMGWLDTVVPYAVPFSLTAIFTALIYLGLRRTDWAKNVALVIVFMLISALPLWILQQSQRTVGHEVQPRYLLPAMFVLLGAALTAKGSGVVLSMSRTQKAVALAIIAGAQALSLMFVIRRYTIGTDGSLFIRSTPIEWWSTTLISPTATILLSAIAYAWIAYVVLFRMTPQSRA
jgi:hypothetical protein